jgi:hypothetical protein
MSFCANALKAPTLFLLVSTSYNVYIIITVIQGEVESYNLHFIGVSYFKYQMILYQVNYLQIIWHHYVWNYLNLQFRFVFLIPT